MDAISIINILLKKNIFIGVKNGDLEVKAEKGALTNDLIGMIRENKAKLLEYLDSTGNADVEDISLLGRVDQPNSESTSSFFPLSYAQRSLWFHDFLQEGSAEYNILKAVEVVGDFDVVVAEKAFSVLLKRHQGLRVNFQSLEGEPVQCIRQLEQFRIEQHNLNAFDSENQKKQISQLFEKFSAHTFDLSSDLLFRVKYLRLNQERTNGILILNMHHIITDAWSNKILLQELLMCYRAIYEGNSPDLTNSTLQYTDFSQWQNDYLQGETLKNIFAYWQNNLANLPELHNLPLDYPRPKTKSFEGGVVSRNLSKSVTENAKSLAQKNGMTLFMFIHSMISLILSRYSQSHDIVMGMPVANRSRTELNSIVGYFVNTLVLRVNTEYTSLSDYLKHVREVHINAQRHQEMPLEYLVQHLTAERNLSHTPLFQVCINMLVGNDYLKGDQSLSGSDLSNSDPANSDPSNLGTGISFSDFTHRQVTAKFDLTVNVSVSGDDVAIHWIYDKALFDASSVESLADDAIRTIESAVKAQDRELSQLTALSEQQRQTILVEWNDTGEQYPQDKCIHELFERQAEQGPDAIAVVYENTSLSYAQLNRQANQLARYLIDQGVKIDMLVGLCVERSPDMIVGILAVLKAGGAYLPLDPSYPKARLEYMLDDADIGIVLTQTDVHDRLGLAGNYQRIDIDNNDHLPSYSTENIPTATILLTPRNLAYAIYTSGSTGLPKASLLEHQGVCNLAHSQRKVFEVTAASKVLQFASFSFDAATFEWIMALCSGAQLCLLSQAVVTDGQKLSARVRELGVTHATLPPALLPLLNPEDWNQVSHIIVAGDSCPLALAQSWSQGRRFYNAYGPSEATVCTSIHPFSSDDSRMSIGRPIDNVSVYVLDQHTNPVPVGVAGELYIGGVGLSRGYFKRPDMTAERFILNCFSQEHASRLSNQQYASRLYKTGDMVRWLPDGNLEFLGRMDQQVKIRGFRIELGEIESTLTRFPVVEDAVVVAKASDAGDQYLVGYVALETEKDEEAQERSALIESLRQHLSHALPDYMVPSSFVFLDELPLTPNGKVDRKALPEPDTNQLQTAYVAPCTETEKVLCAIWQEVLGVERVGVSDNFFHLGGHSLLVMKVIASAEQHEVQLSARKLFETRTLADLAADIDASVKDGSAGAPTFTAPVNKITEGCEHITLDMLPLVQSGADGITQDELNQCVAKVPGGAANVQDIYPLAALQEGFLFHHMMSLDKDPYVLSLLFEIKDGKAFSAFVEGLQFIVDRHDVMRTAVMWRGIDQPLQIVSRKADLRVTKVALDLTQGSVEAQMRARCTQGSLSMDLEEGALLRLEFAVDEVGDQHFVLFQLHHIISDHVGLEVIQRELAWHSSGQVDQLPTPVGYREFVAHAQYQAQHHDAEAFFKAMLGDVDTPSAPFDLHDILGDGGRIVQMRGAVSEALSMKIRTLAKNLMVSPAVIFHASWAMVLSACSGRDDIVFGTVMSGRLQGTVGAEDMLGVFINTLPLRVKLDGLDAMALVRQVHASLSALLPYEQASLALAERCSGISGDAPLFSAIMNFRHTVPSSEDGRLASNPDVKVLALKGRTNFPFNLSVDDVGDLFRLDAQVDQSIGAERILDYVQAALASLTEALSSVEGRQINTLNVLPEHERHQLLVACNATEVDVTQDNCVHECFEQQAKQNPDAIAVMFEGEQLSYKQLNQRANQLAHYLMHEQGVVPDTLVGICVERSIDMLVGILGILKAGGAYVPLDPEYPVARLSYMIEDAKLATVLTQQHLMEGIPFGAAQSLCLNSEAFTQALAGQPITNPETRRQGLSPDHLAYVMYTSGSTGKPKAVMQVHQTISNLVQSLAIVDGIDKPLRTLQYASINFDVSLQEIATAWHTGGCLWLISDAAKKDIAALPRMLYEAKIERLFLPPAILYWLTDSIDGNASLPHLREIFVAGEALTYSHSVGKFRDAHPECVMWNHYGPTETHVVTRYRVDRAYDRVPIGVPVSNTQALILNEHQQLVPRGVAGELHIGGAGLARGYLHRPELSAEKFIANPYFDQHSTTSSKRLYKTGDLVRWLPDGNLEFLGRIDHQVKIRGFRIELGEIENRLINASKVKEAVVIAKPSEVGENYLVAYTAVNVEEQERPAFTGSLRHHLSQDLPDYMLPSVFVFLDELPLTPNGKVDRRALPEPDLADQQDHYIAPRTEMEKILCELWQEVLGIDRVGIDDNFFHLGGHSLSATRLVGRINGTLDVNLPLKMLFSKPKLAELAEEILVLDKHLDRPLLLPASREQDLLPSYAQQRLWVLDRIDNGSAQYNIPAAVKLNGILNIKALTMAVTCIVERHESLRTCFSEDGEGRPLQVIRRVDEIDVPVTDLSLIPEEELGLAQLISEEASRPFDLAADLMLRAQLVRLAEEEHILLVTMHHIASDGWSMSILINEFSQLYRAYKNGKENPLPALAIQYADYAHWQRRWLQGEVLAQQMEYWAAQLAGLPVVHSLPLNHQRPTLQSFVGKTYRSKIDKEASTALHALCEQHGATLFMGLHAAFSVFLSRYSNETDIVVGSPIANREQSEVAGLIGFFVNTLVLRSDLSEQPSFNDLLNQSKNTLLDAYAHQQVPFEHIVEHLKPERSLSHSPLFQIMLVLQNNERVSLDFPGLRISEMSNDSAVARYDLTLVARDGAEGLQLIWQYNTELFESSTIARMVEHFSILLEALITSPKENVFKVEMLSSAEQDKLLIHWNDTEIDYPGERCIHELFEQQVEKNPDAIAVVYEDISLTYKDLNKKANQLAHYLIEQGVKADSLVGLCVERSLDMIVGILGVLKAGGAYLPLDPNYPEARLQHMLDDAEIKILVTQKHLQDSLDFAGDYQCIFVDHNQYLQNYGTENIVVEGISLGSGNLAYAIYTSGSTGLPKASILEHRGLSNLVQTQRKTFEVTATSKVLQFASFSFDAATFEWCMALCSGAQLCLLSQAVVEDASELSRRVRALGVSHATLPPALLPLLNPEDWEQVTHLIVAGDSCPLALAQSWSKGRKFFNAYGPSEATVCTSIHRFNADEVCISIGRPIDNVCVYVLDQHGHPVPTGVTGELYVGGVNLARGYLNRPEITAEKFIASPFHDKNNTASSERLYKTGDLVRWLPDGNLGFLGRIDHQVKIRGFRIELGEIENTLVDCPEVLDAVVLARDNSTGDRSIVAYVVVELSVTNEDANTDFSINGGTSALIEKLRQYLSQGLPDYMLPSAFVFLNELPLTLNGKVDRRALPEPDTFLLKSTYIAPQTQTEKTLCDIWKQILLVDKVSVNDNFFHLGGHSLKAVQVASAARSKGLDLTVKILMEHQTVSAIASQIEGKDSNLSIKEIKTSAPPSRLPLLPMQSMFFNLNRNVLNHWNVFELMEIDPGLNVDIFERSVRQVFARHEGLRTTFVQREGQWCQKIAALENIDYFNFIDLANQDKKNQISLFDKEVKKLQTSLVLSATLGKVVYFRFGSELNDRVLFLFHHLVFDAYSSDIFRRELSAFYDSYRQGTKLQQENIRCPVSAWAPALKDYANSNIVKEEIPYWKGLPWEKLNSLPIDAVEKKRNGNINECVYTASIALDAQQSSELTRVIQGFVRGLHRSDLLFAIIALALSRWSKQSIMQVGIVKAGRSDSFGGLDGSQAIGCFVRHCPFVFDLSALHGTEDSIRGIVEQYRNIPNGGMGFGLLKHLCSDHKARVLHETPPIEVELNYAEVPREQAPRNTSNTCHFLGDAEATLVGQGFSNDPNNIEIMQQNWRIVDRGDKVVIAMSCSNKMYKKETADGLMNRLSDLLISFLSGASNKSLAKDKGDKGDKNRREALLVD